MSFASLTWLLDVPQPQLPPAPAETPSPANYTSAEVSTAVSKLVQGAIRRPYGILGERQTGTTFDDTMDAASGVFILTPEAPFYVILLGTRRLSDVVASLVTSASDLLECIRNTGRRVPPLTNITSLGNARTALAALESASAARDSAFEDILQAPAFQRFDKHTNRFLADAASAIRVDGEVVQTPQQARARLAGLVSVVTEATQGVQRRVQLLSDGIDDYNSLNLPALLAQGVIGRAKDVLQERIDELDKLTPTQRLGSLRDTTLDVLAGKAVVKGFGSLVRSGTFVPISGNGQTFTDAEHPGNQAVVSSRLLDPYVILVGEDELTFLVDGGPTTFNIPLPKSFLALLEGVVPEPWDIVNGVNDDLNIGINDSADLTVDLTVGVGRTAQQIVADINAEVTTHPVVAETFLNPEKFIGEVDAVNASGVTVDFVKTGSNWVTVDVGIGDAIIVQTGVMAQLYFIVTFRSGNTITCSLSGPGAVVNASNIVISAGPPGRFIRVRISDAAQEDSLNTSRSLSIRTDSSAATTLGFFPGMARSCRRTRADEVAQAINASSVASPAGVARVSAVSTFVSRLQTTGRTEPSNSNLVVSSIFRGIASTSNGGNSPIFAIAGAASAGVVIGNVFTLRSGASASQTGLYGTVTAVSDTQVTGSMQNGSVTIFGTIDLEFGLDLEAELDQVVRILSPSPITGDYRVTGATNPMEVSLDRFFPVAFGVGGLPLTFEVQVGAFRVDFKSESRTVNSQLAVSGTAGLRFFTALPGEDIGSTPYVLLENDPKVLAAGDKLELYSGQYQEPELSFTIIGFEQGQRLLEVDTPIPVSFIELDFSTDVETPFARIRKIARNNYDDFKVQLGLWLDLAVNESGYFRDLNRFLNPIIVNDNPTLSAVSTAAMHVQSLVQALQQLQLILSSYQVETVPQVDTLIDSFLSRGSDRAVDTLLEARFTEFFGYNSEEVSYIGNTLERLRDVSRLDLPVRRTARKEVIDQELTLAEFEEPDFEFDQSDTQDSEDIDIPGSFIEIPGSNF